MIRTGNRAGALFAAFLAGLWLGAPAAATVGDTPATSCPAVGHVVTVSLATMQQAGGLQGLIDACPTGTTFDLPAGTFPTFRTIYPQDGDSFVGTGTGAGGTILLGSKTVPSSNFTKDQSGDWVDSVDVTIDTRSIAKADDTARKNCSTGYYPQPKPNAGLCDYPDMLYMDGAWLVRTLSSDPTKPCPPPVGAGNYCINYDSHRIYLGSNPSGHTMTFNGVDDGTGHLLTNGITNSSATDGTIVDVTVRNLAVSFYANTSQSGGGIGMGDGWTVTNVVSSYNHGCGMSVGGTNPAMPKLLQDTTLTWNGQSGFCGMNAGTTFDRNTVTYNNQDFWSVPFGGGGGKFSAGGPITVSNSVFSHNKGNGLGFDVGEQNMTVTGNTFADNINFGGGGHGLHIEVSCYATVTGNTAIGNERIGIDLLESHHVTVTNNTVGPNGTGEIEIGTADRSGTNACGKKNQATNDLISNNTVAMTVDSHAGITNNSSCNTCVAGSSFSGNTYSTGGNCAVAMWKWFTGSTQVTVAWTAWKTTYSQDAGGSCT